MKKKVSLFGAVALAALALYPQFGGCAVDSAEVRSKENAAPGSRWEPDIQRFEEQDKKSPPPADATLFIGSSSFRLWNSLAKDFAEIPVINRGFGGSEIADSTQFVERIVLPYKPRLIVIYAGGNDLEHGKTPAQVLADFQAFVARVRAGLPAVPVVYISINPSIRRWRDNKDTRETNCLIAEYIQSQPKLLFIDSFTPLLGPDGLPQKALLRNDELHLNSEGYKAWLAVIKPPIVKLYKELKPKAAP